MAKNMQWIGLLWVALISMLPFVELRFGIPVGIFSGRVALPFGMEFQGFGLPLIPVFLVAITANIFAGLIVFLLLNKAIHHFTRFKLVKKTYDFLVKRVQRKSKKYVEKFGGLGLALFIAMPLPGTGAWTGALAAFVFGMSFKKFAIANTIGVIIAGIIVSALSSGVFSLI
ncbi:MAG: small multi-drug export protein [Candidatus Diapherotrites archaeon]